jgi:hypothetical protein
VRNGPVERGAEVRPGAHHLVVHRDTTHDGTFAARHRGRTAQQGHDVTGVDVEGEFEIGLRQPLIDLVQLGADVDHMADQVAITVLRHGIADMAR